MTGSHSRRIPWADTNDAERVVRRPSGLELYRLDLPGGISLPLLILPGRVGQLGSLELERSGAGGTPGWTGSSSDWSGTLGTGLELAQQLVRLQGCARLMVRLELPSPTVPGRALVAGLERLYTYRRLGSPLPAVLERLEREGREGENRFQVEVMPTFPAPDNSPFFRVPVFMPWFTQLFRSLYTPDTDAEIAADPAFQLALLELILSASWQHPRLHILKEGNHPVGMLVSRWLWDGIGELAFVGLEPRLRGNKAAGRALMRAGVEALAEAELSQVRCGVAIDNPRSLRFFEHRWGFEGQSWEEVWGGAVGWTLGAPT